MRKVAQLPALQIEGRQKVLLSLDIRQIQSMERDDLLMCQEALGFGATWGEWEVPEAWCPPGQGWLRWVRCRGADTVAGDRVWTEVLRVCLLLALTRSVRVYCLPSTICHLGRSALSISRLLATKAGPATRWWSRATTEELRALGPGQRQVCAILATFYRRGLVPDEPAPPRQDDDALELDRHHAEVAEIAPDSSKQWQPLPDAFTATCGQRVLWLVEHLGSSVLDCLEACLDVTLPPPSAWNAQLKTMGRRTSKTEAAMLLEMRATVVRGWVWRTPEGQVVTNLPFLLYFKRRLAAPCRAGPSQQQTEHFAWPPRTWGDLWNLVQTLQSCQAWLLFLASGPRQSTVLSYTIHCLVPSPHGFRLDGTIFKTPMARGGRPKDWPLPPLLVRAVQQQVRLAGLVKRLARPDDPESLGEHLWVRTRGSLQVGLGGPISNMNNPLQRLVEVLGVGHLLTPDNPTLHTHRFRKTLARIVALALTSAQIVLMDCFGHEDPEMTLGYMVSDKSIVADALRVQRELVILLAREAIQQADDLGGPIGEVVRETRHRFLRLKNRDVLTPKDEYELADQLTLGGREWVYLMEGVICTLSAFDAGPCGAYKGLRRDPLNCQAGCKTQLILAHHKNHANDMIAYLLPQLQRALDDEADSLAAQLIAQLQNHLYRWPDVYAQWAAHSLVIRYGQCEQAKWWLPRVHA